MTNGSTRHTILILFRQAEYKRAKEYIDATMAAIGDDPPAEVLEHAGDIVFMLMDR